MTEIFDRKSWRVGRVRAAAEINLADRLEVPPERVLATMRRLNEEARAGRLSEDDLKTLEDASDRFERLTAVDSPWVFGHRYFSHLFVTTDPMCTACGNSVPHRTLIKCPTCGEYGPWSFQERPTHSSYIHYVLVAQMSRILDGRMKLPGAEAYADGAVNAVPRGGAKSTWLAQIGVLWAVLTGRSRCALLVSNTIKQVTERAIELKTELESNQLLTTDFGPQAATRGDPRTWTQEDFILANGSRVVARGAMQSMRGVKNNQYRPDLVVADDADDEKYITTYEQATKLYEWWDRRVVPACVPNAVYLLNGTVIGELALLYQTMTGHRGASFVRRTFKAINDRPGCDVCGMPAKEPGMAHCPVCDTGRKFSTPSSFWGARFTVPALNAVKERIGLWAWLTEFEQEPHNTTASWFRKDWLDAAKGMGKDLTFADLHERRLVPWSVISATLDGQEMVDLAAKVDPRLAPTPGRPGPYQLILQSWDPAWARKAGPEQNTCFMGGVSVGLTWDDKIDVMWVGRDRGLSGTAAYRKWMYDEWVSHGRPTGEIELPGQSGMIIERNSAGVLFQYEIEEHWGGIPMIDHQTGTEKHDLLDGIPGMASWFERLRVILRCGDRASEDIIDELVKELMASGRSHSTDMLMALWFAWAYCNRWMRDRRDPARYDELVRRRALNRR